eukprot:4204653-Amphidinium_carterae.1
MTTQAGCVAILHILVLLVGWGLVGGGEWFGLCERSSIAPAVSEASGGAALMRAKMRLVLDPWSSARRLSFVRSD